MAGRCGRTAQSTTRCRISTARCRIITPRRRHRPINANVLQRVLDNNQLTNEPFTYLQRVAMPYMGWASGNLGRVTANE